MRSPMKTRLHLPLLLLWLGISSVAWAKDAPTLEPNVSTQAESKVVGDPYPAADALVRKNRSVLVDAMSSGMSDFSRSQAWDGSGTKADLVTGDGPSFAWFEKHFNESMRNCSALDLGITPQGISWSDDLRDFAVSPQVMQSKLAQQGYLFAPLGTKSWKILRASFYAHFDGRKSQMQRFMRIIMFVTTASPSRIRQTLLQLSADRGYRAADQAWRKMPGYVGGDSLTILKQQVTPNVRNMLWVSVDQYADAGKEDATQMPSPQGSIHCLVTDDFGKDWLNKINPNTGKSWQPADLTTGYMTQISPVPLGEKTEPFTNAHVDERLARERHMTTQQIAALRKAEETQVQKEIWRDAPQAQKALATQADALDGVADVAEHLRRSGFAEQWASMMKDITHRLGVHIDGWIDAQAALIDAGYQKMADLARRGAKEVREFLSSLWG